MSLKKLPVINAFDFPRGESFIEKEIYSRWQQNIRAENDDNNTITIYQTIADDPWGDGFSARRMAAALRSIGKKDVVVSINSPGGDFFEGVAIYNLLREHPGKVTVKVIGLAASAASIVAMAGDEIQISEAGFLMIHNAWAIVIGNRNDLRKTADIFEKFDAAMADVYAARTEFDRNEIVKMMDADTWLNSSDAIEKGFADDLMPAKVLESDKDDKKSKALARRSLEMALAKQGYSRKDREEILRDAFGAGDTAGATARDAGQYEAQLMELIKMIRS